MPRLLNLGYLKIEAFLFIIGNYTCSAIGFNAFGDAFGDFLLDDLFGSIDTV